MPAVETRMVLDGVGTIAKELVHGPQGGPGTWILDNDPGAGLLATLGDLDAEQASRPLIPGRASIAAHAHHVWYSLSLLNRAARGENPYADADWAGSWKRQSVSEEEWRKLLETLKAEADAWLQSLEGDRKLTDMVVTGLVGSAGHLAYHLGALRQVAALARQPE